MICIDTVGPLHNGHLGTEESGHCTEVAVIGGLTITVCDCASELVLGVEW